MKDSDKFFGFEKKARKQGRIVSASVHIAILLLGIFPLMRQTLPLDSKPIQIVMDFSSGSSQEGTKANKPTTTKKSIPKTAIKQPKPIKTSTLPEETIPVKPKPPVEKAEEIKAETKAEEPAPVEEPAEESTEKEQVSEGKGNAGSGDAAEGNSANGSGRGFIEGTGVLTRAVIDRGDTKSLAQVNGTLILKICINKRGLVTYAEWDKEQSSIKDPKIARDALDNVLNYRFESDYNAPSKECGRLTYIIEVD